MVEQGSLEHATQQLEAYRALLEKEVIASFDKAVQQKDLGTMAECARVMTEFERGNAVLMQVLHSNTPYSHHAHAVQRYTSSVAVNLTHLSCPCLSLHLCIFRYTLHQCQSSLCSSMLRTRTRQLLKAGKQADNPHKVLRHNPIKSKVETI